MEGSRSQISSNNKPSLFAEKKNLCEICGRKEAEITCPKCGRRVCTECFNYEKKMCLICSATMCSLCGNRHAVGTCQLCGRRVCKECSVLVMGARRVCVNCLSRHGYEKTLSILLERVREYNRRLEKIYMK